MTGGSPPAAGPDEPAPPGSSAHHVVPPDRSLSTPPGRRRRGPLVGLLAAVVAAAVAVVGVALHDGRGGDDPSAATTTPAPSASATSPSPSVVAAPQRPDPAQVDAQALARLFAARAAAVRDGDLQAWLAAVSADAPEYRRTQKALFKRLRQVPFSALRFDVDPAGPLDTPGGVRTVDVRTVYRLPGDERDVVRTVTYTLSGAGSALRLADQRPAQSGSTPARDLWDVTDVAVLSTRRTLVIGAASRASSLRRYAAATDAAVDRVDALWGDGWRRTVVVVVPGTVEQMAEVLGHDGTAGLSRIAAVTTGEIDRPDGSGRAARTADRVVLNPDAFDATADPRVRRVVLTHELTHVATRGTVLVGPPLWLEEAFADWVGYRGTGLSAAQVAAGLLTRVREGDGPSDLPDAEAFDPTDHPVDDAYSGAWLALDMVEQRRGAAAVVDFYRTAAGLRGARQGDAMTTTAALDRAYAGLGTDAAGFRDRWLAHLQDVARP